MASQGAHDASLVRRSKSGICCRCWMCSRSSTRSRPSCSPRWQITIRPSTSHASHVTAGAWRPVCLMAPRDANATYPNSHW
jgi:hypothetical protein